jgi:putative ABC transport system permease protein
MSFISDLRHGARLLFKSPAFTLVAIAALTIGIGANAAIFSVINTLLLQRLPYPDADRLAIVWEHNIPRDRRDNVVSPGNYLHWRELNQVFDDMAAVSPTSSITLTGAGDPEPLPFRFVSANFFPIVGVGPALGRAFTAEEDRPRSRVVVISDRLWRRRFGGDPAILQRAIVLEGNPYAVTGVMPPDFSFLDKNVDAWVPVGFTATSRTPVGRWLQVVGRLKPGVTFAGAQADMERVAGEMTRLFPDFNTGWTARVVPLREQLTGGVRPALLTLAGAVGFVLLIACANVANLLLARATVRQRELAIRAALGAGRARLVRQLLAESLVLAVTGGVCGLLLAWWALHYLRVVAAARLPIQRLEMVGIDGWVLAFTLAASALSGLIFGVVPALTASGSRLTDSLKDGGRSGTGSRGGRTRAAFVTVEIAAALVLLAGAGLLVRSFARLLDVNPGFDTQTITMRVSLPSSRYGTDSRATQFYTRLFDQIDALPGVQSSGAVSFLPLAGPGSATSVEIVGKPQPPKGSEVVADVRVIAHNYLQAMGVPLLRGRLFKEHDAADATNRVVINEAMARAHWPGEDPIGKRVKISWDDDREHEIIGVVGDVRHQTLDTQPRATTYWPYERYPYAGMTITVRAAGDSTLVAKSVVGVIRTLDPNLAVAGLRSMDDVIADSVAERRLTMLLLTTLAGAALLLAAVGIYGVIAYSVTQRTQEIGIRMALGARGGDVLRMVVLQAVSLSAAGIAIGAAGAQLFARLMKGLLFGVTPTDPVTFAAVSAALAGVALLASYVPGRRATRVDPVIALRAE